ncbi:MAG TPA: glycosyltransferase family 9 protein [Ktedonobacteraceae bacterium]|nr:glycosyltransferase family 9 protein [Ktedonobacteraceae bacterium]
MLRQRQAIEPSQECTSTSLPSKPPGCIALHPGSGGAHKCWPVKHFAAVIDALWQHKVAVLPLAGPAEQERLAELLRLLPAPPDPNLLRVLVDLPLLDVACQLQHMQKSPVWNRIQGNWKQIVGSGGIWHWIGL